MSDVPEDIAKGFLPYNEEVPQLRITYAETPFVERHVSFRDYFPSEPARVLDVGAGIGADALGFAELGHKVVAVEPADAMRTLAREERDHENITWLSDYLPDLNRVRALNEPYDFILASASFMHLSPNHQQAGMTTLGRLIVPGGYLAMSLRHGPVPIGRTMYEISPETAIEQAAAAGLSVRTHQEGKGRKNVSGVTWSNLVFGKDAD